MYLKGGVMALAVSDYRKVNEQLGKVLNDLKHLAKALGKSRDLVWF